MRYALASLVLALFLFPSLAMGETMDDLVITSGLYYKKFTEVPFSGKVTGQYQGKIRNGKKEGPWVEYNSDGRLSRKVTYKNGKEDTSVEYHYLSNGQLEFKTNYKEGKIHGPLTFYYPDGQLKCTGSLATETKIKDIKGNWFNCYPGGLDGDFVKYHKNGQLAFKTTYKDGKMDGPLVNYHKNGQLKEKGTFKDGEIDGPWVYYHENGQLGSKGTFKDGERDGPWVFYRENGDEDLTGASSKGYYVHEGSGTYKDGKKISN